MLEDLQKERIRLDSENKELKDKMNREIENSFKSHYVKNIIYSYLSTNDANVRVKLRILLGEHRCI